MSFSIDDSAFPNPGPLPTFADLAVGDVYRLETGTSYFQKMNASSAYDFSAFGGVEVSSSVIVQPVDATLVIEAP